MGERGRANAGPLERFPGSGFLGSPAARPVRLISGPMSGRQNGVEKMEKGKTEIGIAQNLEQFHSAIETGVLVFMVAAIAIPVVLLGISAIGESFRTWRD